MIAASPAPMIAAAMMARARREVLGHFRALHAVSASEAVPYTPDRRGRARQFEWLRSRGVLREAAPGQFWLDLASERAEAERRRCVLVPLVIVLALVAAAIPLFFYAG